MKRVKFLILMGGLLNFCHCSSEKQDKLPDSDQNDAATIEWAPNVQYVSDVNDRDYHGYARIIQLKDSRLMLVYFDSGRETNGGIMSRYSSDGGKTWTAPEAIHHNTAAHEFNNPEVMEMSDGTLFVLTNLRPYVTGGGYKFEIGLIRKPVGGEWSEVQILYSADNQFHNGCWEPKMIELPDGNLEIYFANENNFRDSDDQEISKLYSIDKGLKWTGPIRYTYAPGARDGMPVSLVLDGVTQKVLTAIEDNSKGGHFTISILESPAVAGATAAVRLHGVVPDEMADKSIYCGAPYLARLPNGGLVLTGQTSYKRPERADPLHVSVPFVAICEPNSYGKFRLLDANLFNIAPENEGLWNSVAVVDTSTVLVLTSTQSPEGFFKIAMKTGRFKDAP
jgi:hypothetical protein